MNLLMLAAACSPYQGSEPAVGWLWARAAAERHQVWVVVAPWCVPRLEQARAEGLVPDSLHVVPAGNPRLRPPRNKFLARFYCWWEYADYQRAVPGVVERLRREVKFDLAHHTTIATWRGGSPLAGLDIPYVWGPLGGGESIPWGLAGDMSWKGWLFEAGRAFSGRLSRVSPRIRAAARNAAVAIATNADNERVLRELGRTGPVLRCPMLVKRERFDQLRPEESRGPVRGRPARIFTGGGLHAAKGVALALRTVRLLRDRGVTVRLTVGGHGSEDGHLRALARRWNLGESVEFVPGLGGEAYLRTLRESDVFLLPSLRDNTSLTLVEAMAAGLPCVVLDHSGPTEVVAEGCGIKVPVGRIDAVVRGFAAAVELVLAGGPEIGAMTAAARRRVEAEYLEDRAERTLHQAYALAVKSRAC